MVVGVVAIMMIFILIQFVRGTYGQPQSYYTQEAYERRTFRTARWFPWKLSRIRKRQPALQ